MNDAELALSLLPGWSHYIPETHSPWPKQLAFCMLPHREALYGGAAGGGKSDAMLMSALMFVDVPYYSAIIFRRTLTDLLQNEGLLSRAMEWLAPYPEVKYIPSQHCFVFSSQARLTFGYMGSTTAWEHYQGSAYQFIGWDELTQHAEIDYREMMSRLRRVHCPIHGGRIINGKRSPLPDDPSCEQCRMYGPLSRVPLRIRSTSNPGGRGHIWVKKRFKIHKDKKTGIWVSGIPDRPFIAATFFDNLALDHESYEKSLDEMDEARTAQLKEGDWDKLATGLYKPEWFREYEYKGGYYVLFDHETGRVSESFHESKLRIYSCVDVACSVRTGVADKSFYKNREPSWSVIGTFGVTPSNKLLILDIRRFQEESPSLFKYLREVLIDFKPMFVGMEVNGPGKPIAQMALDSGVPIKELVTVFDKISNSAAAQRMAKAGYVYLPKQSEWVDDFVGECTVWTGHPHEPDDQVDVLSNAANEFRLVAGNMFRDLVLSSHTTQSPGTGIHSYDGRRLLYEGWEPDY